MSCFHGSFGRNACTVSSACRIILAKRSTPLHRLFTSSGLQPYAKDAEAAGIPNTVGDRYRYFIDRAVENVKTNPGFYVRNVGAAVWEYANTFGPRSRATSRYANRFSSADQGQRVFLFYLLAFTFLVWLLQRDRPFARSNLLFLLISIGLVVLYQILPPWATFVPLLSGVVFSWAAGRRMPNLILAATLAAAVLGSAIFANPVLFRAILMTDWLFVLYFLAAVWFPAETLSRRLAGEPERAGAARTEEDETSSFQNALSLLSRQFCLLLVIVTLGFFLSQRRAPDCALRLPARRKRQNAIKPGIVLRTWSNDSTKSVDPRTLATFAVFYST